MLRKPSLTTRRMSGLLCVYPPKWVSRDERSRTMPSRTSAYSGCSDAMTLARSGSTRSPQWWLKSQMNPCADQYPWDSMLRAWKYGSWGSR